MATLILSPGEKLEDFTTDAEHGYGLIIEVRDIDVILQQEVRGETIIKGPFQKLEIN
jgi:hypothetical protein